MKTKKKTAKAKSKRPKMPMFFPIDDEMKELSAMLEKEIADWPGVSMKPMFGYQGLYRDGRIFSALPRSRAMRSPRSLMIKFASASPAILASAKKDSRAGTASAMSSAGWRFVDLHDASASRGDLEWLGLAYDATQK